MFSADDNDIPPCYGAETEHFCQEYMWVCIVFHICAILGSGIVIDSDATSTVCGLTWLKSKIAGDLAMRRSERKFRFGDGMQYDSQGVVYLSFLIQTFSDDQPSQRRPED